MDYDWKYKEALERAKKIKQDINNIGCSMDKDMLDIIFPELAESEDERIRKRLIGHLKECRNQTDSEVMIDEYAEWIAWLEKQKEQKPAEWSEKDEKMLEHTKEILNVADADLSKKLNGEIIPITKSEFNGLRFTIAHCLSWLDLRLKSLRPQPHWKPSEEQMEVMKRAVHRYDLAGIKVLKSLYNDLKKL